MYGVHDERILIIGVDDVLLHRATNFASIAKEMEEQNDTPVLVVYFVAVGGWKVVVETAPVPDHLDI